MSTLAPAYHFSPVTRSDLPLLYQWQRQPHVLEWWDDPDDLEELAEALEDPFNRRFLVQLEGFAIGYIQAYDPHGWPDHHFAHQPAGVRGVDQFIADENLLGQGHGAAFVRQFCDRLFAEGAPVVVTDPHPANFRAIRAYEKAGFSIYGGPVNSAWGSCLLMARGV
jgi:aminoglycoside 6'-N-acetyltransferase